MGESISRLDNATTRQLFSFVGDASGCFQPFDDPLAGLHSKFLEGDSHMNLCNTLTDEGERMNVDVVDDGYIPGCAILNIGIEDFRFQKMDINRLTPAVSSLCRSETLLLMCRACGCIMPSHLTLVFRTSGFPSYSALSLEPLWILMIARRTSISSPCATTFEKLGLI